MTDDGTITNKILFDHIQLGRKEVREFKKDLQLQINTFEQKMDQKFQEVDERLNEAKKHREAIAEDLDATIRMQAVHDTKIAVLTGGPMPENY